MIWPLWNLLDFTPEGRGTDWYPSLTYSGATLRERGDSLPDLVSAMGMSRQSAAHTTASALLAAYCLLIATFWAAGGSVGISVAAASGGIAPFQCFNLAPFVYPVASTVVLVVARQKMAATLQTGIAQ